jgi:aminopeptidase C
MFGTRGNKDGILFLLEYNCSLDQNPQALVSTKIARVRIHERGLTHAMKLMGSTEPNVQQSPPWHVSGEFRT